MPHRIYFWRVKDRNGRLYQTRFRTTEERIRKEHPEAERIDSDSMEVHPVDMYQPTQARDEYELTDWHDLTVKPAYPGSYECEITFIDDVQRTHLRWDGKEWEMAHVVPIWWYGMPTEFRWHGLAEKP